MMHTAGLPLLCVSTGKQAMVYKVFSYAVATWWHDIRHCDLSSAVETGWKTLD
jgi:hypothetical protein